MYRIFIAMLHHESNGFNPILARKEDFSIKRGEEIFEGLRHNHPVAGILSVLQAEQEVEIIPGTFISAVPNGEVETTFYLEVKEELLAAVRNAERQAPLDAVILALHGSMQIEGIGKAETPLLQELRDVLGEVPIFASLDTHANIDPAMVELTAGLVAYKCAPHTDQFETGQKVAEICLESLKRGKLPAKAWQRVPLLFAGEQSSSTVEPIRSFAANLRQLESENKVISASYLMGFPWTDNPAVTASLYVLAHEQEEADYYCQELAAELWARRAEFKFQVPAYHIPQAVELARDYLEQGQPGPLYLSDSGDNPTAGGSSDHTDLLRALLEEPWPEGSKILYAGLYDPAAVEKCREHCGEKIKLRFGASFDPARSQPLELEVKVLDFKAGIEDFGRPTDLVLLAKGALRFVLASQHIGYISTNIFKIWGLDPQMADIVAVKLGYLTPEHAEIARKSILVLSHGATRQDLASLNYQNIPRPIYPLDVDMQF